MIITKATKTHLENLVPLFDGYRVFYRQKSDYKAVREFLNKRLTNQDSIIYLVFIDDVAVGFMQLYFLLSSVSMKPMYVLNDLYIDPEYRNKGVGSALIDKAKSLCIDKSYKGIVIQTENHNPAQHLYQREGFVKDVDLSFFWTNYIT
ncbi:MAG: GNAT family N-acetyltransferase [Flaviramulus sp.]|nr:GNAT family N-acetyltransferase [Flaviramulus sp.]NNC51400.1 GNAT family N-acetyltransferase [Flaviramulus sp.]